MVQNEFLLDCTDPQNRAKCDAASSMEHANFPDLHQIQTETQKFVRETLNPYVSFSEESDFKSTIVSVVLGTFLTIIGFATAIVVGNLFSSLFPAIDWFTAASVVIVAIGLSVLIGVVEVRISRAALKTRFFRDPTPAFAEPKDARARQVRQLYEQAYSLCTQANLAASVDQSLLGGSFADNLRNACTEELFSVFLWKSELGGKSIEPSPVKSKTEGSVLPPSIPYIAELKKVLQERGS